MPSRGSRMACLASSITEMISGTGGVRVTAFSLLRKQIGTRSPGGAVGWAGADTADEAAVTSRRDYIDSSTHRLRPFPALNSFKIKCSTLLCELIQSSLATWNIVIKYTITSSTSVSIVRPRHVLCHHGDRGCHAWHLPSLR